MKLLLYLACGLAPLFFFGTACSAHESANSAFTSSSAELSLVHVDEEGQRAIGLKLQPAEQALVEHSIKMTGEAIVAEKDYFTTKSAYEKSQVRLETLKQKMNEEIALRKEQLRVAVANSRGRLEIMGLSDKAIDEALSTGSVNADLPIPAPASGTVTSHRSVIFIKQGDHFAPVTVHLSSQSGTVTEILDDIKPGVPVVVQGATQLKAQAP